MKLLRKVLFWSHLTAGVIAGVVILVMSFTGAALALKPQILNQIERDVRFVSPEHSPQLSARALLRAVHEALPDASPVSLARDRNPGAAATVNVGTGSNVYVNPYTGAVLGTSSARANQVFQMLTTWHRYMGATREARSVGKSATGASNLAFLVLALSGFYLWWPSRLTVRHVRSITWFRRTSTGRQRDFNWHNVIGFWCLPAIVIMTVSGAVISYPWASNLVYRLTGSPVPAARGSSPATPTGRQEGRGPREGRGGRSLDAGTLSREGGEGRDDGGRARGLAGDRGPQTATVVPARLDAVWARAEQQVPTWSVISLRLPSREDAPVSFAITDGAHWNTFARSTLVVDSASAEVVTWQPYENGSLGQKVRGWLRFAHTGELGGLTGQILAGLGCLGGVMMVYTGLSLAWRRLWGWSLWSRLRAGRRSMPPGAAPQTVAATMSSEAAIE